MASSIPQQFQFWHIGPIYSKKRNQVLVLSSTLYKSDVFYSGCNPGSTQITIQAEASQNCDMWLTKSSFNEEIYRNLIIIFMEIKIIYRNGKDFGEDMAPAHVLFTPLKPLHKMYINKCIHFILNYSPKIQTLNLINLVELCIFVYNFVIICTFLLLLLTTALFLLFIFFPMLISV